MIKRAIASWFTAALALLIFLPGSFTSLDFAQSGGLLAPTVIALVVFGGLWATQHFTKSCLADDIALAVSILGCAFFTLLDCSDVYFCLGVAVGVCICLWYLLDGDRLKLDRLKISDRALKLGVVGLGLFFAVYIGTLTALRYLTYSSPNFDFGIFCNMFFNMKETLLPNVTCERDGLLSHFAVHVSPIYYLLLPFYMLFPSPVTLELAQALVLASGVIPVYLLCRRLGLSNKATLCFAAIYVFFPALAGGCFYDLHENKFLAPLILWLMYFIEKRSALSIYISMALVLMVKEDAPVYIMFIALYLLISKREYKRGAMMLLCAAVYFVCVTSYLDFVGDGVMTYRYENFIYDSADGLVGVIKTVFLNPARVFLESFNTEKLEFMLLTLLPLGFMPFLTRKISHLILVLPYMLVNLMSDYQYQHSIYFQYTYATCALLLYLSMINLAELSHTAKKTLLTMTVTVSILFFTATIGHRTYYINNYISGYDSYVRMSELLETIPDDASVKATTFLVPKLSQRFEIYAIDTIHSAEYAAIDLRSGYNTKAEQNISKVKNEGYTEIVYEEGLLAIYKCSAAQ